MRLTIAKSAEHKPEWDFCRLAVLVGIGRTCELVVALLLLGGTGLEVLVILLAGRADAGRTDAGHADAGCADAGASCNGRESDYITR